jgi:hypothetical protein
MPGPRNRTGTDPSLNHPLIMSYMGADSGWEKGWGAGIFTSPARGGSRPKGARGGCLKLPCKPEFRRLPVMLPPCEGEQGSS